MKKYLKIFFSPKGRIKRYPYLIAGLSVYGALAFVCWLLLIFFGSLKGVLFDGTIEIFNVLYQIEYPSKNFITYFLAGIIGAGIFISAVPFYLCVFSWAVLKIKRLHDLDHSGWWIVLYSIPFVNLFFGLYLLLRNSADKNNKYNYQTEQINLFIKKYLKVFFSPKGRMKRQPYLMTSLSVIGAVVVIYFVVAFLLSFLTAIFLGEPYLNKIEEDSAGLRAAFLYAFPAMMMFIPTAFILSIKRLHDLRHSELWILFSFIPVVNLLFWFYLLLRKSADTNNKYDYQIKQKNLFTEKYLNSYFFIKERMKSSSYFIASLSVMAIFFLLLITAIAYTYSWDLTFGALSGIFKSSFKMK